MSGFTDFLFNKIPRGNPSKLFRANGFSSYEEYLTGGGNRFYYNKLSRNAKLLYDEIIKNIESFPSQIEFPVLMSGDDAHEAYSAVALDNPILMMLDIGERSYNVETTTLNNVPQKMTLHLHYAISRENYFRIKKAVTEFIHKFEKNLSSIADPFEKELYIHDYITENTTYDMDERKPFISTPYGVLFEKRGLCEGYSKTMKVLLEACDIETILVSGIGDSSLKKGPHMWNQVKVNGRWYNLDATWDSTVSPNTRAHNYFNLEDRRFYTSHSTKTRTYPCISLNDNYYFKRGLYFERFDSPAIEKIKEIARRECTHGTAEICFSNRRAYTSAVDYLINQKNLGQLLLDCFPQKPGDGISYSYSKDDENCVLRFSIR